MKRFWLCLIFAFGVISVNSVRVEQTQKIFQRILSNDDRSPLMVGVSKINATLPIGTPLGRCSWFR
jgi:hypothetical protein